MRINQKDRFCHISEIVKDNWQYPTKDFYAHLYSSVLPETIKNAINIENGLTVIGSRPAVGKTTLMLQIVLDSLISGNVYIYFPKPNLSREDLSENLLDRMMTVLAGLTEKERIAEFRKCVNFLLKEMLVFICTEQLTAEELYNELNDKQGCFFIDFIQLLESEQENEQILQLLFKLSRNNPVFALSQVCLSVDYKADKHPAPEDMLRFGNIQKYADKVITLYVEDYYKGLFCERDVSTAEISVYEGNSCEPEILKLGRDNRTGLFVDL